MKRSILFLAPVLASLVGCADRAPAPAAPVAANATDVHTIAVAPVAKARSHALDADALAARSAAEDDAAVGHRHPGDYVVYRYSGSFTKVPRVLRERVLAREGSALFIELKLTEGKAETTLRARIEHGAGARTRVTEVARIVNGKPVAASVDDYEALLGKTLVAADENDGEIASNDVTVDVAGKSIAAHKTTYKVRVGGKSATMSVLSGDNFAWGDLGGEIVSDGGKPIYRAELVESGSGPLPLDAVATSDDE